MKKKIIAICVVISMLTVAIVSSTMAYFTDTDEAVNVMTMGNVSVVQNEEERTGTDGNYSSDLRAFTQNKELIPAVYSNEPTPIALLATNSGKTDALWDDDSIANEIDKIVTVTNTGKSDAYVRTLFAFELPMDKILLNMNSDVKPVTVNNAGTDENLVITVGDGKYAVFCITYADKLAAGETTPASLRQFAVKKDATQDDMASVGEYYEIFTYTQAVQASGFDSASEALDAAFGAITATNNPWTTTDGAEDEIDTNAGVLTLENGETVRLIGRTEPLTVKGNGTLELINADIVATSGDALTVDGTDVKLVLDGVCSFVSANGSGIGGTDGAVIDISGSGVVTAIGNGDRNYGIGGDNVTVNISDVTVAEVAGGFADATLENIDKYVNNFDYKYAKNAPEGGPAIGGSVIMLDNVVIENAVGGSKAAGIGAMYWNAVDITIKNSVIKNVEGGISAAGIGGSRVAGGDATAQTTTITIADSDINAVGGYYAAGIGSGYDTHCHTPDLAPMCTINISGDCDITAQGGKYAAGIGTGYHAGLLAGEIEASVTVNAASGEKFYKDSYTKAQDIGFGVLDPARDGLNNTSTFTYNGTVITVPNP